MYIQIQKQVLFYSQADQLRNFPKLELKIDEQIENIYTVLHMGQFFDQPASVKPSIQVAQLNCQSSA